MGKVVSIVVAGLLTMSAGGAIAAGECAGLTITGHPEYAPIAWRDGDRIVGAAPTLVETIAAGLNVPVVSKYTGSWEDAQAAARDGAADIIFGIYYNDERATYLDYVQPPFMLDPVVAEVAAGKAFPFTGQDDLIGKKGVTNTGESYGQAFDAFIADRLTVTRTAGVDKAFDAVISGEADYVIVGLYPGITAAAQFGVTGKLDPLDPPLVTAEMFIAFSKKSPCLGLMDAFSAAIAAKSADGSFAAMLGEATTAWQNWVAKN
jgi:polar amino acid transport system substrate-binding protein